MSVWAARPQLRPGRAIWLWQGKVEYLVCRRRQGEPSLRSTQVGQLEAPEETGGNLGIQAHHGPDHKTQRSG